MLCYSRGTWLWALFLSVSTQMLCVSIYFYEFGCLAKFLFPVLHCTHLTDTRWTCFSQRGETTEHGRTIKEGNKIFQLWCFSKHAYLLTEKKKSLSSGQIHSIRTYILLNGRNRVSLHTRYWEVMDIPQKRDKINKWTRGGAVSAEGERHKRHRIIPLWWPNFLTISMKYTLSVQLL